MSNTALRVLMLAPTPYFSDRGCHVRIYEEARALIQMGYHVCVVTYHLGRDMPDVPTVRIPKLPWYRKLEAGPSWHKPYLDVLLLFQAYRVARRFKPHLIHAHLHEGALIGAVLKRLLRIPMLFDYQGSLSEESLNHRFFADGSRLQGFFRRIEGFINDCADAIITSSGAGRQMLLNDWGVNDQTVTTLIDGVDTAVFQPYPRSQARRELGIPTNARVVVYLGLFNTYQGLDQLLEALMQVREQVPQVHLLLMGYPEQEYRHKAYAMGLNDLVTFTGRVPYDRAPLYLSAGDIAVSPKLARTEANGKLFNYMACGLPTVVYDSEVNREILGETGIYAEYGSGSSLADCLSSALLLNETALSILGRQARMRAVDLHSWYTRVVQLDALYHRLINKNIKTRPCN